MMPDPTPVLTLFASLREAGAALITIAGACREHHMHNTDVHRSDLAEADRAVAAAVDALRKYRIAQVERNSKLMESV